MIYAILAPDFEEPGASKAPMSEKSAVLFR